MVLLLWYSIVSITLPELLPANTTLAYYSLFIGSFVVILTNTRIYLLCTYNSMLCRLDGFVQLGNCFILYLVLFYYFLRNGHSIYQLKKVRRKHSGEQSMASLI